jgi:hypothetical protein
MKFDKLKDFLRFCRINKSPALSNSKFKFVNFSNAGQAFSDSDHIFFFFVALDFNWFDKFDFIDKGDFSANKISISHNGVWIKI